MEVTEETTVRLGRNHIIERPRLTRLLDETSARVIMLVAPAGYGKTTLARQWLANRPHAWYQGSAASADVAALGLGIVDAASPLLPNIGKRLREWLPMSSAPEKESDVAAELVAVELEDWPDEAWFVIDDYHLLSSEASEELARRLFADGDRRLLITSRARPTWASARQLLYGHVLELGQSALSMNMHEAQVMLSSRGPIAKGLAVLADGWPAVLGLAALTPASALVPDRFPERLHDYFAEELLASLSSDVQSGITHLALLPEVTPTAAEHVIGPRYKDVLTVARAAGLFVAHGDPGLALHPLLRSFLTKRLISSSRPERAAAVRRTTRYLVSVGKWAEAFALIKDFEELELLDELITPAFRSLLKEGRLATLTEWIDFARERGLSSPSIDLADAEVSFRRGLHKRASVLAHTAARSSRLDGELQSAAFYRAGQTAYLADDTTLALQLFDRARRVARTSHDVRNALWGEFRASIELEKPYTAEKLDQLASIEPSDLDSTVRLVNGRLMLGIRQAGVREALEEASTTEAVIDDVEDPIVRSAFWHVYSAALILHGEYREGQRVVDRALSEIEASGVEFARPHVLVSRASASIGLGDAAEAEVALNSIERSALGREDDYLMTNARACRCRLLLEQGAVREALSLISQPWGHSPSLCMQAEYLAAHAAALALNGHLAKASRLVQDALRRSRYLEPQFLGRWVGLVCKLLAGKEDVGGNVRLLFSEAVAMGPIDTFVFAYRIEPRILQAVADDAGRHEVLASVLRAAEDSVSAKRHRLPVLSSDAIGDDLLTPREKEVYALLAMGKRNREIAADLFITETTAKVHVRNVLRKLGVRSRTEAALRAVREGARS
jgi:ATP/maltotriose-dependent transcriptional regulator MalT